MISFDQLKKADGSFAIHSSKAIEGHVSTLCSLDSFQKDGIVFIKNKRYYRQLQDKLDHKDSVHDIGVVFEESLFNEINEIESNNLNQFRFYAAVKSVDMAFTYFSKLFFDELNFKEKSVVDGRKTDSVSIHPSSCIAENVFIGEGVVIAADAVIHSGCVILSNSKIGERTTLYPNVVICRGVNIGQDCIIHANSTIGSDGFRFNYQNGSHQKVWHFGGVIIENFVEIGSNTSIDQGTFSPTVIGEGTKIDNQVHIAHNCHLGKKVIICGQCGLAGSVTLGEGVILGGAVNVAPGVEIGNNAQIGGMSGVTGNVPAQAIYGGHPARPLKEWLRSSAYLRKLSLK